MGDFMPAAGMVFDAVVLVGAFWILYWVLRPSPKWIIDKVRHIFGSKTHDK